MYSENSKLNCFGGEMQIKDSVALITGAGSGIGEVVSMDLANRGCKVALVDMDESAAMKVADSINKKGGEAIAIQADVSQEEETAMFVSKTLQSFNKLNIVIPCAGIIKDGLFLSPDSKTHKIKKKLDLKKWQSVLDVNLTGTFLTIRDSAEAIHNGGWPGLLVPISSINKVGQVGQLNYSSSKVATALFPKILIGEFMMRGIKNIRVVGIAPGYASTPLLESMNQNILDSLIKDIHLGRLVEPLEISSLIMHCAENEAINATTIEITGGICFQGAVAK